MPIVDDDGFIRRILSGITGLFRRVGIQPAGPQGIGAPAAAVVTFDTAMQQSFFWACAKLITETIASLPLVMYRTGGDRRVVVTDHWLWRLLAFKPNRWQNSIQFWHTVVLQLCTSGNAYCLIERNGASQISSLVPLMTAEMDKELLTDGSVVYYYRNSLGVAALAEDKIWHLRLFGNGIIGLSPLEHQRNALGLAQAAESRITQVFRNGAKPSGILMVDAALTKPQRAEIRASFRDLAEGGADSLVVLDKFMKYQAVSMSPQDIELLQARRFQGEDICRFMGVPSILVNDASQATVWGTGIRSIIEGWYKTGLRPLLELIECGLRIDLLPIAEREQYEFELDFDSLLRMDLPARLQGYQQAINSAQLMPNEARALEGRGPAVGGDRLYIQGATVPLEQAGRAPMTAAPAKSEQQPIQVLVQPAEITVNNPPVNVQVTPQIEIHGQRRGEVVREVVERDPLGIPSKVIEREIRRGET